MDIWASLKAQLVKNLPAMQETWVRSLGWEDTLEKGIATHSSGYHQIFNCFINVLNDFKYFIIYTWIFIRRTDAEAEAPITLATWCEELTCWERLKAGGEGDDRGWDGWMPSLTQWTWVWANSQRWWRTGKPGMLRSMGSQRIRQDLVTQQQFMPETNTKAPTYYTINGISEKAHDSWDCPRILMDLSTSSPCWVLVLLQELYLCQLIEP